MLRQFERFATVSSDDFTDPTGASFVKKDRGKGGNGKVDVASLNLSVASRFFGFQGEIVKKTERNRKICFEVC